MLISVVGLNLCDNVPEYQQNKISDPSRIKIQELLKDCVMMGNRTQKQKQKRRVIHFSHQNRKIQNATIKENFPDL